MSAPAVSIVLPTYNGARWLAEAVDSVLAQSFGDFELIVVVDGSTDATDDILGRYRDPRVRVHRKPNGGLPAALNSGFELARGRYLGWTSDDNLYLPDALRAMVSYLDRHPSAPMVCTDCLVIDDAGHTTRYTDEVWACFLYRDSAARAAGPYRPEFRLVEDVDFFLRLQHFAGPIERINEAHYKYRVHQQSLSHQQIRQRHMASLKLHYDLITRGIEREDLRELFHDRLARAATLRDYGTMDEMLAFARARAVPFLDELAARDRFLRTLPGHWYNRLNLAARSRLHTLSQRIRLLRGARPA